MHDLQDLVTRLRSTDTDTDTYDVAHSSVPRRGEQSVHTRPYALVCVVYSVVVYVVSCIMYRLCRLSRVSCIMCRVRVPCACVVCRAYRVVVEE